MKYPSWTKEARFYVWWNHETPTNDLTPNMMIISIFEIFVLWYNYNYYYPKWKSTLVIYVIEWSSYNSCVFHGCFYDSFRQMNTQFKHSHSCKVFNSTLTYSTNSKGILHWLDSLLLNSTQQKSLLSAHKSLAMCTVMLFLLRDSFNMELALW